MLLSLMHERNLHTGMPRCLPQCCVLWTSDVWHYKSCYLIRRVSLLFAPTSDSYISFIERNKPTSQHCAIPLSRHASMSFRSKKEKRCEGDVLAAAEVALRAIKECTDAYPPLKSVAAAAIVVIEMSQVRKAISSRGLALTAIHAENEEEQRGMSGLRRSRGADYIRHLEADTGLQ